MDEGANISPANSSTITQLRYEIGERGPHHRVWNKIIITTNELGEMESATNIAYVELATGLHYSQNGQWRDTEEAFTLVPGWALARKGPHKVGWRAIFMQRVRLRSSFLMAR